jgi:hypothetical protein
LRELEKYENLETLKPNLMFILYTKDLNALNQSLINKNLPVGGLKGKCVTY